MAEGEAPPLNVSESQLLQALLMPLPFFELPTTLYVLVFFIISLKISIFRIFREEAKQGLNAGVWVFLFFYI